MVVLGIDPGTAATGYGIIRLDDGWWNVIDYGFIKTEACASLPVRLRKIFDEVCSLIDLYRPDELAVEEVFYYENVKTALMVGHARGVILLAAVIKNIATAEYSPREVKQAVAGNGAASKEQVQRMVRELLQLREMPVPFDAADALAVAICHCNRRSHPLLTHDS